MVYSNKPLNGNKNTLAQYEEYMNKWIKRKLQTIDNKIPPDQWYDTLNKRVLTRKDGTTKQKLDDKTLLHLRNVHDKRNRLQLISNLYDTRAAAVHLNDDNNGGGGGHVSGGLLKEQLNQLLLPGAAQLMDKNAQLPSCCGDSGSMTSKRRMGCSIELCNAYKTQFSEKLIADLSAAEIYIANQQVSIQ
jgi:hypothetical protein